MTGYRRIILTGGIGTGKSYVARHLTARGWDIIEADRIGHEVLEGPARDPVASRWPETLTEGAIDRTRLAEIVFSDASALAETLDMGFLHESMRERLVARGAAPWASPLPRLEAPGAERVCLFQLSWPGGS